MTSYTAFTRLHPLRNSSDLLAIDALFSKNSNVDAIIAVTQFGHYPFQALFIDDSDFLKPFWPQYISKKGSEFPDFYCGNGSTYAISIEKFLKYESFLPTEANILPYIMPQSRSIDIDTIDDLHMLEMISENFF